MANRLPARPPAIKLAGCGGGERNAGKDGKLDGCCIAVCLGRRWRRHSAAQRERYWPVEVANWAAMEVGSFISIIGVARSERS